MHIAALMQKRHQQYQQKKGQYKQQRQTSSRTPQNKSLPAMTSPTKTE